MKNDNENKDQKEKVEELVEENKEEVQINEFEEKYKRALADYQNLQRRTDEQKREWILQAGRNILLKLLPVLDTLMLANKHINDKGLTIGIEQYLKTLEEEGVIKIKTVGEKFNPHLMEAIGTMEGKKDEVIEEARAGYMLHDQVLRSAQVIVGA